MKNNDANYERKQVEDTPKSVLEEIIREGARRLLQQAIEDEVSEYIERWKHVKDERGRRMVVKNGKLPERSILTTIGPLPVIKPRVNDKREGQMFYEFHPPALSALHPYPSHSEYRRETWQKSWNRSSARTPRVYRQQMLSG